MICANCRKPDFTARPRPSTSFTRFVVLCAECNVDLNRQGSTTAKAHVPERVEQDRYAQMAARYGVR